MKKRFIVLLVIAGLAAAGVYFLRGARQKGPAAIQLSGTVETREIQVGSKVGGRVSEVLVDEGQLVKQGAVLLRFEVDELLAQRDQLRGKVAEAEAQVNKLRAGYRPEEIQQAEAATRRELAGLQELQHGPRPQEIAQALADYEAAKADAANGATSFARINKLHATDDVSSQALDEARARRDQLAGRSESARQRLELLRAGTRAEEVRAAEQRYRAAQAAEQMMHRGYRREDVAEANARLTQAKAQLSELQVRLAESEVLAPAEARVEVVSVRPGDLVAASRAVMTLLEASQLWVKVYVPEPELGHVTIGQTASVQVDSFPGRNFQGTIEQISDRGEFLPRNIQTREDRNHQVFGIKVRLENSAGLLKSGMAATVKLQVQK
ncbi:MAG: efflux RND transporter periplasmic adaptor subunit [Bryobacteraceae bacterium]